MHEASGRTVVRLEQGVSWRHPTQQRGRRRGKGVALLCGLLLAAASFASDGTASDRDDDGTTDAATRLTEGFYVVRSGDTLEGLAQRYLGDTQRWRELWRLNGDIENPHRLQPGQRLRILVQRLPDDAALLAERSNRVENKMVPLPWTDAARGDVLRWRDSLRTFEESSAALRFGDDTQLIVNEESLIFLDPRGPERRRRGEDGAADSRSAGKEADIIEIVVGQADLVAQRPTATGAVDDSIELVLGDTVARPQAGADGALETRARRPESGGAKLMVYSGSGAVESAGAVVEVPQGMGTAVEDGAAPSPPEELLQAPSLGAPAAGAALATPRPRFTWATLDGAAEYVVEVCSDPECAQLVARVEELSDASWRPETKLPVAALHWRVTARSASGLDGYPSPARALTVTSDAEDTTPPTAAIVVQGPHLAPRQGLNQRWILSPDSTLVAELDDPGPGASGIAGRTLRLDEAEVTDDRWREPSPGPHDAALTVRDAAGLETEVVLAIFVDDEPPILRWGVETNESTRRPVAAASGDLGDLATLPGRSELWIDDPHSWLPWRRQRWQVQRDPRQLVLRPLRPLRAVISSGETATEVELGPERGLWVLAEDVGTEEIRLFDHALELRRAGSTGSRSGELTIAIEAGDAVGNRSTGRLRIETRGAP
ncbi:MAG: LysM peptidoglycan-binding domain-containing protein [Acidobacteriota bacterium]